MGKIEYVSRCTREMIRDNPDKIFIFGDNAARIGLGGQAKEARGEPNTIGIATLYAPYTFFGKSLLKEAKIISGNSTKVLVAKRSGKTIVAPLDGVGTGLSKLNTLAPSLYNHIVRYFQLMDPDCPWKLVKE